MKKKEMLSLWMVIGRMIEKGRKIPGNPKFYLGLLLNRETLQKPIDVLSEMQKPDEEFKKYDEQRIILCQKFSVLENGVPKIDNQTLSFVIRPDDAGEFDRELGALQKEYQQAINKQKERNARLMRILEEDIDIDLIPIDIDTMPQMLSDEVAALRPIIRG